MLPDFEKARRQLRRARIQDALGIQRSLDVEKYRNLLLERLPAAADSVEGTLGGGLTPEAIDSLVSLAVTRIPEQALDSLSVKLMAIEALAGDGHIARLRQLSQQLEPIADDLASSRPLLSAAVTGLSRYLENDSTGAEAAVAGVVERSPAMESSAPLIDYLLLSSLSAVTRQGHDSAHLDRARALCIRAGDGIALNYISALRKIAVAYDQADALDVLQEADDAFLSPRLANYVSRRERKVLFPAQVAAIRAGATTRHRAVVALPTSSGKTFVAELRVAALLEREPEARVIYVAPYRLLARQVEKSFSEGLSNLNATVSDLGSRFDTSDGQVLDREQVPHVSVVTPERLDSLLRMRSQGGPGGQFADALFSSCRLIVFDELQLLGRRGRGARMELLITRILSILPEVGILGLSAAAGSADTLGTWLGADGAISGPALRPTGTLEIAWATTGELVQRVGQSRTLVGRLERSTNATQDAASLVLRLSERHGPVLAVCVSRPIAESMARRLTQMGAGQTETWWHELADSDRARVLGVVEEVQLLLGRTHPLATQLRNGFAVHHASVPTTLLRQIEALANDKVLRAVCATTTVAEGSDLPFKAVVVPHLNFPGRSRRLEKDLYLNLIGRAGRASVSVEGMSFVLESDARTLKGHVREVLWSDQTDSVSSVLESLPGNKISDVDDWEYFFDVQNQVLGWLGDGASYVPEQATSLARLTFGAFEGNAADEARIVSLFDLALSDLEDREFAVAASPYRLTESGQVARLTGLSAPSAARLLEQLNESGEWSALADLESTQRVISAAQVEALTLLLCQTFEVLKESLWIRRTAKDDRARFQVLAQIATGSRDWPTREELAPDLALISGWLRGMPLDELGLVPPRASRANSLFGGSDEDKLTSDAAEYIGNILHPLMLTWSGAQVLNRELSYGAPAFLRGSIEFGAPNQMAVLLMRQAGLTRPGALNVAGTYLSQFAGRFSARSWDAYLQEVSLGRRAIADVAALDLIRLGGFVQRRRMPRLLE